MAFSISAPVTAQTSSASVGGQVKDSSGAVIPDAVISVVNTETNVARGATANAEGIYVITNLIPGSYKLSATFQGFKNLEQGPFTLRVGDRVTLDLTMEVGSQTERISVTAEVPLLRTEDAQTGQVIDNRRIQELPQYNRNALAFATLTANVNGTSDQMSRGSDFRINGGRTAAAEYYIDGLAVSTGYYHDIPPAVPSMEAVGEFKVITNGLSAEYGRLSGGAVTLVTRAGTNEFHGSAYEFFKNDMLNANDWNSNRFGRAKGVFHENVFGASLGGPIWIPKVYKGRDKTFFFLNFEGGRYRSGSNTLLAGVPTELERSGDFSQTLIDSGLKAQIFDPLTAKLEGTRVKRDPFPGNMIPQTRFNPLSKIYLGYYPQPNRAPRPGSSHDSNFVGTSTNPSSNNKWTGRLDQNWNERHATHFTATHFDNSSQSPRWLSPLQAASVTTGRAYTGSLDHIMTISPTTTLNLRGGIVRSYTLTGQQVDVDAAGWPIQQEVLNLLGTTKGRVPLLGVRDTITDIGGGQVSQAYDTIYSGLASLQKLWGRHTLKVGYEHRRYYSNVPSGGRFSTYTVRSLTSQYYDSPVNGYGSGLAGWLLGGIAGGDGVQYAGPASLQTYHGAYIQDDFRVNSKLTINMGIRWDFEPPRTERFDRQTFWDKDYKWPWTPNAGWSWDQVLKITGTNMPAPDWVTKGIYGRAVMMGTKEYPGRTLQWSLPYHFGPRLGMAYQLMPKTVLRASYGVIWGTSTGSQFLNGSMWNIGYGDLARLVQGGSPDGGLTFPLTFDRPMPNGIGYVPVTRDVNELNKSVMGNWFLASAPNITPEHEHVISFNLQREFGSGTNSWVIEGAYNANLGRGIPYYLGMGEHILPDAYHKIGPLGMALSTQVPNPFHGQIAPLTGMGGATLPYGRLFQLNPLWSEIWTVGEPLGTSNYHSGYFQVEHRFGRGFSLLANYTLSKLLQDSGALDGQQGMPFPQAGLGLGSVYGLAGSDITHKMLLNYSWDLPVGKGKALLGDPQTIQAKALDKVLGGWSLAGTTTFRSGTPIAVRTPSNTVGGPGSQWYNIGHGRDSQPVFVVPRVNYNNGVSGHTALEGSAGFTRYFDPAAFRIVQGYEIGDVPSYLTRMRGPGFSQFDFALMKSFPVLSEARRLQLRFEAQNILNHMNAGNPDSSIVSRTFGMITSQSGIPRRIMIAAKFQF
ncbi:MAG: carboxypeptidase regulatory-like domain-containing protein [Bryobacterales bacterium]|nr:carboxypeptidase regulatory-like domain-containing protein [Bryobacterales bacterium]